jgi:hypothetical protein
MKTFRIAALQIEIRTIGLMNTEYKCHPQQLSVVSLVMRELFMVKWTG